MDNLDLKETGTGGLTGRDAAVAPALVPSSQCPPFMGHAAHVPRTSPPPPITSAAASHDVTWRILASLRARARARRRTCRERDGGPGLSAG